MNPSANNLISVVSTQSVGGQELLSAPYRARVRVAQTAWAAVPLSARLKVIRSFRHLLAEQPEHVANSANLLQSRPISEILASEILPLTEAARFLEREAESVLASRRVGFRGRPLWLGGVKSEIHREAFGLVLIIAPSNYAIFLPGVQILQALVAGNAVWLKPGPDGAAAALELARLLGAAGLPEDLLQVLPESADAAQAAIAAGVDKVSFTGSARIGKKILAQLAPHAVPATMELSGCDAVIVRADADLDLTIRALTFGLRLNGGQTCIAPRRVFVARSVATEFEGRLTRALVNCPTAGFVPAQQRQLAPLLLEAVTNGAHLLAGKLIADAGFNGPLALAGVSLDSPLLSADIFGPLLLVLTVGDDDEAVRLANNNPHALGATIFTRDETAALALAKRIEAGVVLINDLIAPTADARLPFGGRKLSGFGVTRGREGLLEMTTQKIVTLHRGSFRPHFDKPAPGHEKLFVAFLRASHGAGWRNRITAMIQVCRTALRLKRESSHTSKTTDQA